MHGSAIIDNLYKYIDESFVHIFTLEKHGCGQNGEPMSFLIL